MNFSDLHSMLFPAKKKLDRRATRDLEKTREEIYDLQLCLEAYRGKLNVLHEREARLVRLVNRDAEEQK